MEASKYVKLYSEIDTKERKDQIYRLVKAREYKIRDLSNVKLIKGVNKKVSIVEEDIKKETERVFWSFSF